LGFHLTSDDTSSSYKNIMMEKWVAYAEAITSSTLEHGKCPILYGAYYMPSLVYGTPTSSLTYMECEDIHRPVVAMILPKMGIVGNVARVVVFSPLQYCGLGLGHLTAVKGYNLITYLIGHLESKSITRKLIRNQLEYTQVEMGCGANPLAL
jgi:hypothetical protein